MALLDIPSKFASWREAVGRASPPNLALQLFQAALNLSEARKAPSLWWFAILLARSVS